MSEPMIKNGYCLFWGEWPSNWTIAPFTVDGVQYNCVEQYMMAEKARFFGDDKTHKEIMKTNDPRQQKKLGRTVDGFDAQRWSSVCFDIVLTASLAKYRQNDELKKSLLETGDLTFVEASPYDKIWGIGLDMNNENATRPGKWLGKNLLGKVLDKTREIIRADEKLANQ